MVGFKAKAAVQPGDFIQDLYSFLHYLFSHAVPGNDRYFIFFHIVTPLNAVKRILPEIPPVYQQAALK
jgi:hypothetical protein